ncbi:rhodanese-like domain-containing protein [Bacillus sp. HMF5848]|uniref:rhodanese-like domain-containing protein n=1 Tax=Bacillus sp. HMF5848 TaxID=2495421 RepID=UPI000F766EA0|nr:rhodanese-like domain-containing protein [Bacillus sp. HMF5848]RSK29329.1 rhodanese-like domain-containing protein [Bacillus sp. HMF5848]
MKFMPVKGVTDISTAQLKTIVSDKSKQFIDVRTPGEYKSNHIKQFKNVPLNQINSKINDLSKESEIVVICQSGMRSKNACKILKKQGFTNITNVKGGMNAWN